MRARRAGYARSVTPLEDDLIEDQQRAGLASLRELDDAAFERLAALGERLRGAVAGIRGAGSLFQVAAPGAAGSAGA